MCTYVYMCYVYLYLAQALQNISILAGQGPGDGKAMQERAELSNRLGSQMTDTCAHPSVYWHAWCITSANPQLHHNMKVHIYLHSVPSRCWDYFLGVMDIIPKSMKHLWVFVFLLAAPKPECLRDSGRKTWKYFLWAQYSLWFSVLRCFISGAAAGVRIRPQPSRIETPWQ
jgi:hypothetical protein